MTYYNVRRRQHPSYRESHSPTISSMRPLAFLVLALAALHVSAQHDSYDDFPDMSYDDDFTWPGRGNGHDICKIHGSSCAFGKCNCGRATCDSTGRFFPWTNTPWCVATCGECNTPPPPPPPHFINPKCQIETVIKTGNSSEVRRAVTCPTGTCACGTCDTGSLFPKVNNTNVCYADCGDCGTEKQTIKFWEVVVAGSVFLLCVCGFGGFRFHARRSRIQSYNVQVNVGTGHI